MNGGAPGWETRAVTPRAWLSLSFTAALWGASYMFIKVALDGGLSEGFIICARTILGAAVLLPMAIRAGAIAQLWRASGGRWRSPPRRSSSRSG